MTTQRWVSLCDKAMDVRWMLWWAQYNWHLGAGCRRFTPWPYLPASRVNSCSLLWLAFSDKSHGVSTSNAFTRGWKQFQFPKRHAIQNTGLWATSETPALPGSLALAWNPSLLYINVFIKCYTNINVPTNYLSSKFTSVPFSCSLTILSHFQLHWIIWIYVLSH
jgi:hypothetical protein